MPISHDESCFCNHCVSACEPVLFVSECEVSLSAYTRRESKLRKLGPATEPLQEKEKQQRLEADRAAKLAKKRAANRERMQRLRNEDAFRDLEVCYCFMAPLMQILHDVSC